MTPLASLKPIALSPQSCQAFLHFVLEHNLKPTTLIICSTREAFLDVLQEPNDGASGFNEHNSTGQFAREQLDALVYPSLRQIAVARSVNMVFVSTIPQLRAYLSTHQASSKESPDKYSHDAPFPRTPMLAVWGLLNLQRSGFEYSAQGLCRTIGSAVDAANFSGQKLLLGECPWRPMPENMNLVETESGTNNPWKELVPLLNGNAVTGGERMLPRRGIPVSAILQRWCNFQEGENVQPAD